MSASHDGAPQRRTRDKEVRRTRRAANHVSGDAHEHPVDPDLVALARADVPSEDHTAGTVELLRLLGDPVRMRILYALRDGRELCVGDLALAVDASETSVSYGLRLLRSAGVVHNRREGRFIFYRLGEGMVERLLTLLRD